MKASGSFFSAVLRRMALASALVLFVSCSPYIGYGVINWSLPELGLSAGEVVPVFIQSNIGGVYVIGTGPDREDRIEVPLWQIALYKSKSRALKAAAKIAEYRYLYATVKIDGLPIRAHPENTARQVYRLRQGETLKIIRKGEGSQVIAGDAPLEGDWYEVRTGDGTVGWCFSYNLTLFDERDETPGEQIVEDDGSDQYRTYLVSQTWYPDNYRIMLNQGRVDLDYIQPLWGFSAGEESLVARVATSAGIMTFEHTGITRIGDRMYRFDGTSLTAEVRRKNELVVQYTDDRGSPQVFYFTTMDITPEEIIANEQERREALYESFLSVGPRFVSGNYGILQFLDGNRFLWSGYDLLSPGIIPAGSGGEGRAGFQAFLSDTLKSQYTGVLSLNFQATGTRVFFLYDLSPDGLKLEQVDEANIHDSVVESRNLSPTILFFTPESQADGGR